VSDPKGELGYQNIVVLMFVQALLGLVTPELRGMSLQFNGGDVIIHVAVESVYESLDDDLDDLVGDMEGLLLPADPAITTQIHAGSARVGWEGRNYRLVFLAKG
jgi:hypothetical protein